MTTKNVKSLLAEYVPSKATWNPIEKALYSPKCLFDAEKKTAEKLRTNALRYSFQHHYDNNRFFHELCREAGVTPNDIRLPEDISAIPLLTDAFFKDYPNANNFLSWLEQITTGSLPPLNRHANTHTTDKIILTLEKEGIDVMFTSGTSGRFSFIPRDITTEDRLRYSIFKSLSEFFEYNQKSNVMTLTPNPIKSHLAIARFFGYSFEIFEPSRIHVAMDKITVTTDLLMMTRGEATGLNEKVRAKMVGMLNPSVEKRSDNRMMKFLYKWSEQKESVYIVGPPFWLDRILSKMELNGKTVSFDEGYVLTGGGWKIHEDQRLPENQLREKIGRVLGIPERNCRDAYAMTECNAIFLACEGHYKHIPSTFLQVYAMDENLKPVGYDEYGRMAFLDSLANSYPGFMITGDRVKVLEECPVCGRQGPVLDADVTRLPEMEGRGCALVMQELLDRGKDCVE